MDDSEIRDWFQGYLDAFAAAVKDPSQGGGMLKFYSVPLILAGDDEARVLAAEKDVLAFVQAATAGLRTDHYSHSQLLDCHQIELNRSTALFRGEVSRRRTDGTEIAQVGGTYLIARGASGLRIFAVAGRRPSDARA